MELPLFDAHCDTISAMIREGGELGNNGLHMDLTRAGRYNPYAQFFAIFGLVDPTGDWDFAKSLIWDYGSSAFDEQYGVFIRELDKNSGRISFCRSHKDAVRAAGEGKAAAFLSVEGGEILDCSIENLEKAYNLGVRAVILTWNFENLLSGSNDEGSDKGLTELGRRFVRRCQQLGVIVDVSHLSEPGFWDVMEISQKPVIASHSNAKAVWGNKRNLTDWQFKAIANTGGVVGINLYSDFLGAEADVDTATEHIEHLLQLGGERHIAIGADLDGCDSLPKGIAGIEDFYKIADNLLKKNYTEQLVCDIFYNNLMRVVMETCDI